MQNKLVPQKVFLATLSQHSHSSVSLSSARCLYVIVGARSRDHADGLTVRKVNAKLPDAKVTFRGAKMNQTMANGVLIFRNTVDSGGLRMVADIENSHGREVMGLHYNKIVQLVQQCSAASKIVGIPAPELVEATLGALHFQLRTKSR